MVKPIIIFCGLMGSGKTFLSEKLIEDLKDYERFNTDEVRRILGFKTFDRKDTPKVNEYMYTRAKKLLKVGKGVLFDSAYKTQEARDRIYQIGRNFNVPVLVVECFCSPEIAMQRIASRESKGDLHKPTNNPEIYKDYQKLWEIPEKDLEDENNSHVSLCKLDTFENKLTLVKMNEEVFETIEFLKEKLNVS